MICWGESLNLRGEVRLSEWIPFTFVCFYESPPVSGCYSILWRTPVLLSVWTHFCQHVSVGTCQSKSVSYTNMCRQRASVCVSVHAASRLRLLHHPADIATSKLLCCSTFWGLGARGSGANNKEGPKIVTSRHTWLHANLRVHARNGFILFTETKIEKHRLWLKLK